VRRLHLNALAARTCADVEVRKRHRTLAFGMPVVRDDLAVAGVAERIVVSRRAHFPGAALARRFNNPVPMGEAQLQAAGTGQRNRKPLAYEGRVGSLAWIVAAAHIQEAARHTRQNPA